MHELHSWPCQDTLGGKYEWNLWDSSVVGSLSCRLVSCFCNRQLMMGELCLSDQHPTVELILHNPQRLQSDAGCYSSPPTASILSLSFFVSVFIDLKPSSSFLDWFSLHHLWLKKRSNKILVATIKNKPLILKCKTIRAILTKNKWEMVFCNGFSSK